jgi:hypothetical protein
VAPGCGSANGSVKNPNRASSARGEVNTDAHVFLIYLTDRSPPHADVPRPNASPRPARPAASQSVWTSAKPTLLPFPPKWRTHGDEPLNMARKSKSMAANNQTAASPHLIRDLNETPPNCCRGCDETAASLQASNLRSLWRTFRHGDASLVGQQVLQKDVQRGIPP